MKEENEGEQRDKEVDRTEALGRKKRENRDTKHTLPHDN